MSGVCTVIAACGAMLPPRLVCMCERVCAPPPAQLLVSVTSRAAPVPAPVVPVLSEAPDTAARLQSLQDLILQQQHRLDAEAGEGTHTHASPGLPDDMRVLFDQQSRQMAEFRAQVVAVMGEGEGRPSAPAPTHGDVSAKIDRLVAQLVAHTEEVRTALQQAKRSPRMFTGPAGEGPPSGFASPVTVPQDASQYPLSVSVSPMRLLHVHGQGEEGMATTATHSPPPSHAHTLAHAYADP